VERLEKWQQSSYPSTYDQPFYLAPYEQRRLKLWAAAGFDDTLLRWKMKPGEVHGYARGEPILTAVGGRS